MDDLISREDALKALDEMSYKSPHESATSVVRKKHFGEILEKFIMQQPSAQQWIPWVEHDVRLKDHFYYLVTHVDYKTPMKAKYHDEDRFELFSVYPHQSVYMWDGKITAWMPLPEPYKGEE